MSVAVTIYAHGAMPRRHLDADMVTRVISGQRVSLSQEDVVRRLKGVAPGAVQEHAVEVGGLLYPVKEAFAAVTGLDVLDFNTNQARAVFKQLGLKVVRKSAGAIERGGGRASR